jgi:putative membrane protein insertion efficiency factor
MNFLAIQLIKLYQNTLSYLIGNECRFHPSCSEYSIICFKNFSFFKAFILSFYRILRCNPFCKGGLDHPIEKMELADHETVQFISGEKIKKSKNCKKK